MLLVEKMELQMEWVQEKGIILCAALIIGVPPFLFAIKEEF